jgi:copper resistance protein B
MSSLRHCLISLSSMLVLAGAVHAQDHAGHVDPPAPSAAAAAQDHSQHQQADQNADHAEHAAGTPVPVPTDAERKAAFPEVQGHAAHDNAVHYFLLIDRLEGWQTNADSGLQWELRGWVGTDTTRLWLRSEAEHSDGRTEAASLEALFGRGVSAWWDVVVGIRQEFRPGRSRTLAALGIRGLAPQRVELEATAYFGSGGHNAMRLLAGHELLFTNRLILQPSLEMELHGKDDAARGIGSGLSSAEAALRLRYEFSRRIAPYLGVEYQRAFGGTANLRRAASAAVEETRLVVGIRTWF